MSAPRWIVTGLLDDEVTSKTKVKQAARVLGDFDDPLLDGYIASAREMVEQYTGRAIRRKTYTASFDCVDTAMGWWDGVLEMARGSLGVPTIELPWIPLATVEEIRVFDLNDNETIAAPASYRVDASSSSLRGRIILRSGYTWPTIGRVRNGMEVDYTAGYTAATRPASLVLAVEMLAAFFYNNRGDCGDPSACIMAAGAMPLIAAYKNERIA
jgi:hypothetical protein